MNKKSKELLLKTIVNTVEISIKPSVKFIAERLDNNSVYFQEIQAQLDRIEHKIDILLSAQNLDRDMFFSKKTAIRA